jgi:hypothetical protein
MSPRLSGRTRVITIGGIGLIVSWFLVSFISILVRSPQRDHLGADLWEFGGRAIELDALGGRPVDMRSRLAKLDYSRFEIRDSRMITMMWARVRLRV